MNSTHGNGDDRCRKLEMQNSEVLLGNLIGRGSFSCLGFGIIGGQCVK